MHESLSALTKFSEATALRAKNSPEIGKTYSSNVVGFLAFAKVYSHSKASQLISSRYFFLANINNFYVFLEGESLSISKY